MVEKFMRRPCPNHFITQYHPTCNSHCLTRSLCKPVTSAIFSNTVLTGDKLFIFFKMNGLKWYFS